MHEDELLFAEENVSETVASNLETQYWKVLLIDDDQDVHDVTCLVLQDFQFAGRSLQFLHAHSAAEGYRLLLEHHDIAVALVDVVMETDSAGLDLVKRIREELNNTQIRLVLRTGQPGQAPEESVIVNYDINDYKDKTELTHIKLKTLLYTTLRSYRDIIALDASRRGLERVIEATGEINQSRSLHRFNSAILANLTRLLGFNEDSIYLSRLRAVAASHERDRYLVLAATGQFATLADDSNHPSLPPEVEVLFNRALKERQSVESEKHFVSYFCTERKNETLLFVGHDGTLSSLDRHLLSIYSSNLSVAFENLRLREEIEETQKEMAYILGEAVEKRSRETGGHVKRVAKMSQMLALEYGLSEEEAELIKLASPLHDVGKIAIPDIVLNKTGKLDADEWEIMKTHAEIGSMILGKSDKRILQLGSVIAGQHHEHWNGNGYPKGLQGEAIPIEGRITAVADVFDALGSKRCYKEPWKMDDIVTYMRAQSGKQFDPRLVEILLRRIDDFAALRDEFAD